MQQGLHREGYSHQERVVCGWPHIQGALQGGSLAQTRHFQSGQVILLLVTLSLGELFVTAPPLCVTDAGLTRPRGPLSTPVHTFPLEVDQGSASECVWLSWRPR